MATWRAAQESEDEAIVSMCLALFAEDPGSYPVDAAQIRRTLAALRREPLRGTAVVLDIDGRIAGYALLISFWSNEVGGELCTVDELFIAATDRNRGHASRLLDDLARGEGPWRRPSVALALEVISANQRAWRLYERLGFVGGNRTMRRPAAVVLPDESPARS